jgi:predicted RecA/RadA family phage recombinase
MKNFIQNGHMITVPAPTGGIASGQGMIVGGLFGIAATTAPEGSNVEIATTGVYDLPKAPATVFALGDRVAWDDTAKVIAPPATGLYPVGLAITAAGNGAVTVRVRLDGTTTTAA